jgi:hypothetical protein
MNLESMSDMCRIKARTRTGCRACFAVASQRALPQQGMVSLRPCLSHLPFASRPGSHFFFPSHIFSIAGSKQIGEGDESRARRFLRVHRSVAQTLVFVFKTLTCSRRAVAAQHPGVEGFSS